MFRNIYRSEDKLPYFAEVPGPWTRRNYNVVCNVAGDFNNDGADDLIVCDTEGPPLLAIQVANETRFQAVPLPRLDRVSRWRNVRLADINLDGYLDLIVTTIGMPSTLYIFRGIKAEPYFDFRRSLYQREFEYSTPDIEVLDANNDGIADIFAIQTNLTKANYCGPNKANGTTVERTCAGIDVTRMF
jgi:FG-GAP-like repeat